MSCLSDRLSDINTTIYQGANPVNFNTVNAPLKRNAAPVLREPVIMNCINNADNSEPDGCPRVQRRNAPTSDYALFTNAQAPGVTYEEGTNISFPTTVFNTDPDKIERNNGSVALSAGRHGRTYLVNYQISADFTDAQLVITEDSVAIPASAVDVTGKTTASGSYIVEVEPCETKNVAVNVAAGTVITPTPTSGISLNVVRIA